MIQKIPKIIHYCWFGGNPLPKEAKKCIASWRKYCPDFEIKEWNENNFDVNSCNYMQEAYKQKKWAFVSDYARFKIIYEYGGIYMDTDVELIKSIDSLLSKGPYMGCEGLGQCAPGLGIAAPAGLAIYREILDHYELIHFDLGYQQPVTVVDHVSSILAKHDWNGSKEIEEIEGVFIYPPSYLCPMNYRTGRLNITPETYSIHWYSASWQSKYSHSKTKISHILGDKTVARISKIIKK